MEEILLVDKPKGITSFDVIRILRRIRRLADGRYPKMGHAGTLDPLASGLMLIGIGSGTKKLKDLVGLEKTYIAEVLLGKQTTTADMEGEVMKEMPVPELDQDAVEKVLAGMIGDLELMVPVYSAVKKEGRELYKYARSGQTVETPVRVMTVLDAKLLKMELPVLTVEWRVKSGVYIRSVAEELGRRLKTVATLQNLRRTRVGEYRIEDAMKLEEVDDGQ